AHGNLHRRAKYRSRGGGAGGSRVARPFRMACDVRRNGRRGAGVAAILVVRRATSERADASCTSVRSSELARPVTGEIVLGAFALHPAGFLLLVFRSHLGP